MCMLHGLRRAAILTAAGQIIFSIRACGGCILSRDATCQNWQLLSKKKRTE